MKVILLKELKGRGGEGDVVDVPRGYATNYLFRKGIAIEASKGELKQLELRRHNIAKRELARTTDAHELFEALDSKAIRVFVKVGEEGQLYGSVTTAMIAKAITEQLGINVDRKKIDLGRAIKTAGIHEITVSLYRDIKATLKVSVLSDNTELEILDELKDELTLSQKQSASDAEPAVSSDASASPSAEHASQTAVSDTEPLSSDAGTPSSDAAAAKTAQAPEAESASSGSDTEAAKA